MKFKSLAVVAVSALTLIASMSFGPALARQAAGNPTLDAVVEKAMRTHNVPGASVAVLEHGQISWARGYGLADPAGGVPVTPDTVFMAASLAKPVTAWGIMTLVDDGLVDLDAPIDQYVTRWHLPPSEYDHSLITVRRILSHTAGLSGEGDVGVEPGAYVPTLEEALDGAVLGMPALHVAYPPGEDYHYSSIGYTLLELAVEEVSGEPFAAYMQREVLDPLGMVNSAYDWTPELRARAAVGHNWYDDPLPLYQYSTKAQGGLRTTASDLALFLAASMPGPNGEPVGRGVLTPESVAETLTPVPFAREAESSHVTGLGWDLIMADGRLVGARKTGDHRGFKPMMVMGLEQADGIAIMANSDRAAIGFLMDIACTWDMGVAGHPLAGGCGELKMIRNVQFTVAGVFALLALAYAAWVGLDFRAGRRRWGWVYSWGRVARIVVAAVVIALWWLLWHTDILLTQIQHRYPCCGYAVTVRALVPWPTAFVWVSWGITLLLLAVIAGTFAPKMKTTT